MGSKVFGEVTRTISKWSQKGEKLLSNGVRLVCPIPHVAPEAWLHVLFPPLTKPEIEEVERNLRAPLPDDFKDFLRKTNGLHMFAYNISIWGVRKNFARSGDEAWRPFNLISHNDEADRPSGSPEGVIYFANADGGDTWCFFEFNKNGYIVGKTDRHNFRSIGNWPDFATWLLDEIESVEILFDSEGVMIAKRPEAPII